MTESYDLFDVDKRRKKRIASQNQNKKRLDAFHKVFNRLFATDDGMVFLSWLKEICGYQSSGLCVDPVSQEINYKMSIHNESFRVLYLAIRDNLDEDILRRVEHEDMMEGYLSGET